MEISRNEFGVEFNKTDSKNSRFIQLFDQFYNGLKSYYSEYQISPTEIVKRLFVNVTKMILSLDNSQSGGGNNKNNQRIDEKCIDEFLFDSDIKVELEKKLEYSLESVRLFSNALTKLRDMIIEFYAKFEISSKQCNKQLTQMFSCSMCLSDEYMTKKRFIRPCFRTCSDAYKSCFNVDFNKLDLVWNLYLSKNFIGK